MMAAMPPAMRPCCRLTAELGDATAAENELTSELSAAADAASADDCGRDVVDMTVALVALEDARDAFSSCMCAAFESPRAVSMEAALW
jgi:hypothetical protein